MKVNDPTSYLLRILNVWRMVYGKRRLESTRYIHYCKYLTEAAFIFLPTFLGLRSSRCFRFTVTPGKTADKRVMLY